MQEIRKDTVCAENGASCVFSSIWNPLAYTYQYKNKQGVQNCTPVV